ncbi:DciA family protein [Sneathiella marina]|uniref:DciA family protein n=1 Tax=Sneathiella marina TaxID=2950108 RepID=A0ABY4W5R8_9PROT|nr:DciA family protein [Sneathiella marina]USG62191.1 DciA family protein [Sneathiella marina]
MRKVQKTAGPRAIGSFVGKSARAALVKRGFAQADILSNWASIVGPSLANYSSPEKLNYSRNTNKDATLRVRVASGWAPEFTHFEPLILERINSFFGYRAVLKLKLIQAPIFRTSLPKKPEPLPLTEKQRQWITDITGDIADSELKQRLESLAASMLGSRNRDRS